MSELKQACIQLTSILHPRVWCTKCEDTCATTYRADIEIDGEPSQPGQIDFCNTCQHAARIKLDEEKPGTYIAVATGTAFDVESKNATIDAFAEAGVSQIENWLKNLADADDDTADE